MAEGGFLRYRRARRQRNHELGSAGERVFSDALGADAVERIGYTIDSRTPGRDLLDPDEVHQMLVRDVGWRSFSEHPAEVLQEVIDDRRHDLIPSVLEAFVRAIQVDRIREAVLEDMATVLDEENYAFRWVGLELVPFENEQMFQETIEPAVRLLHGRGDLAGVESAFREALSEVRTNPGNAVTDAARALEGALAALGCEGSSLGGRLKGGKRRGLFDRRFGKVEPMLTSVVGLVEAIRGGGDDAHAGEELTSADAWFVIHVVGACIVRWFAETPVR